MSALHRHLRLLGRVLVALQAGLLAAQAAFIEVDLVFPRNDTYGPGYWMPVVFAIQSSGIPAPVDMLLDWRIYQDRRGGASTHRYINLKRTNLTGTDPIFVADYAPRFLYGTGSQWVIDWYLTFSNCSTDSSTAATTVSRNMEDRYLRFSTKPGAPAPNLVQSPGTCLNSTAGIAINVTETLRIAAWNYGDKDWSNGCLHLGSPPIVPANPCAVTVNETTAMSILGEEHCGPEYSTTCPASGAPGRGTPNLVTWLLPMLAGLVLYVAV